MISKMSNPSLTIDGRQPVESHSSEDLDRSDAQVELFRALADPTRLEMVRMMTQQPEVACTTFVERFNVSKSTISYHVRTLRAARLIRIRKEGPWYCYRLERSRFDATLPGFLELLKAGDRPAPESVAEPSDIGHSPTS